MSTAELDTIILITKIQFLYINACHYLGYPDRMDKAKKCIDEALEDYKKIITRIDPQCEMYPMLIDLKYKMDNTLESINNTNDMETYYYESNYDFFTMLHDYFPCLYNCTKNIKEIYHRELIKKLKKRNNELLEENNQLKFELDNYKNYADNVETIDNEKKYIPGKRYKYKSC